MKPPVAASAQEVAPGLLHWSAFSPEVKTELTCAAYRGPDGWVVVDPVQLSGGAWEEETGGEAPVAAFLTSGNHARAAAWYRERYGVAVHASAEAAADAGLGSDFVPAEGTAHGLAAIPLPGAAAGETAFLSAEGYLFLGDAVINLEGDGLALLPKKYCRSEAENRASLRKLLDYDFSIVSFAHGTPLRSRAKERLRALLD